MGRKLKKTAPRRPPHLAKADTRARRTRGERRARARQAAAAGIAALLALIFFCGAVFIQAPLSRTDQKEESIMQNKIAQPLPAAAMVLERLIERYGADRLREVNVPITPIDGRSGQVFQARLTAGGVVQAVVRPDGSLLLRELEDIE